MTAHANEQDPLQGKSAVIRNSVLGFVISKIYTGIYLYNFDHRLIG